MSSFLDSIAATAPCYSRVDYYTYFHIALSGKRVLDIGSSHGSFLKTPRFSTSQLALSGARSIVTLDIDPSAPADVYADAHFLPFPPNTFDVIVMNNVIEHLHTPAEAIAEVRRVLTAGGTAYYTIPFLYPVHEAPRDYIRFTRHGLEHLFSAFSTVEVLARGGWCSTVAGLFFMTTRILDGLGIGALVRLVLFPLLWVFVQLDRFDRSDAFTRVYFGRVVK